MDLDLFKFEKIPQAPKIDPVPPGVDRPLFSVMIPVCNRIKYLRQTIESVLHENYPPSAMQICIVDNSTVKIDWESFLTPDETRRIEIFRQTEHVEMAENWNTCVRQARGHLVHILHDDDWILTGFYNEIATLRVNAPSASLFATRVFYVDAEGVEEFVSERILSCEGGGKSYEPFVTHNPLQCAGVVVERSFYEQSGGFMASLSSADMEMWMRATTTGGANVSKKILACYRWFYSDNMTASILFPSAKNLKDILIMFLIFKKREPMFPLHKSMNYLSHLSTQQELKMTSTGNEAGARAAKEFRRQLLLEETTARSFLKWFLCGVGNKLKILAEKV